MPGIFDDTHPPSAHLAQDCVHCGFCLPACPTYRLWDEEMDSPRGRIHLITLGLEGEVAMDRDFVGHFDACLGCMACTTACPSGVDYEALLEATRGQIERVAARPLGERLHRDLLMTVLPRRWALRLAALGGWIHQRMGLAPLTERLPPRWRALTQLLPAVDLRAAWAPLRARWAPEGEPRLRVGLLAGCVQSVFFREVHEASARVLAAEGCDVVVLPAPCCGALPAHAGRGGTARRLARALVDAGADVAPELDYVVVDAAGCGSAMKRYGALLADEPDYASRARAFAAKVRDIHELLDALPPRADRHPIPRRVAYHDACHLAHAQGIRAAPRRLLGAIPQLTLVEIPDGDQCCGSAGIYNLTQPEAAAALGDQKASRIAGLEVDLVAAANPGCALQIERHLRGRVVHPVQLLDASIRATEPT